MSQYIMNRRYSGLSLARQANAHTVLLRMAEDEDRAARIAELKERHPRLTWAKIAEETGVKERARSMAQDRRAEARERRSARAPIQRRLRLRLDGAAPRHARDVRGPPQHSRRPRRRRPVDGELEERITRIEGTLQEILMLLGEARTEQDRISGLLVDTVTRTLDEAGETWANRLGATTKRIFEEAERDVQSREEARDRRATQRSPQG
jgi:hypothetical protein